MKIILSRKGFDSKNGGQANPILPDGTLLSLPIPSSDGVKYSEIHWGGLSYLDIIKQLNRSSFTSEHCHLDPDLRVECKKRPSGWRQAFGQDKSALSELRNQGVGRGDIFLFFGWFRQTVEKNGELMYMRGAKNIHVIYGYLQVGSVIEKEEDIPDWLSNHPHANHERYADVWSKGQNAIFLPSQNLSIRPELPGAGTFMYHPKLVLTKEGCTRSKWQFPKAMEGTIIGHNPDGWKKDYFQSANIGQEFVMDASEPVLDWVKGIFA